MQKTKLLYDIEQLITAKGKETGICRVSLELLKGISQQADYEVYPVVTTSKEEETTAYLKKKGLEYLTDKVIYLPYLKKTTQNYSFLKKIRSFLITQKYKKAYLKELKKYDEYISIFSPISPLVYQSNLKTKIIVHDLIPLVMPESCPLKSFPKKYASWIKAIKADEVICVSEATKKDFLKYRPDYDEKKIKVTYLAADKKFKPQKNDSLYQKYGIPTKKYFLAVSDFNPRKNLIHLIDAFIAFLKSSKAEDVSLVLVGPKAAGYKFVAEHIKDIQQYTDKIIFTGFVDDEDLPTVYSMAHAFVYPSLYEGFGLPPLEAMQCNTPIITCNNSSIPEVCEQCAMYISGNDLQGTTNALLEIYKNETLRKTLSQKGLERAKVFNWDNTVKKVFNLIQG